MREILSAMESGSQRAKLAFEVYVHRLCREIGSMLASLGGLEVLAFTGGVGENCAPLREIVCQRFAFLGIQLDPQKNTESPPDEGISRKNARVRVVIIHAEEAWEMIRESNQVLRSGAYPRLP